MRLIESEKLITDIQGIASEVCMKSPFDAEWFTRLHDRQKEIIKIIESQPKVDAEPVRHGRWIERTEPISWCEDDVDVFYECSLCKCVEPGKSNYCPNCGAKMDEGVE